MKYSAGILFIHENEMLLVHSTNSAWWGTWMPPKGHVEEGESTIDAAIRETEEEIGIRVASALLLNSTEILYKNSKGQTYKKVTIFPVRLISKDFSSNIGITVIGSLQKEEVDSMEWMSIEQMEKRALPRYIEPLKSLMK
jgi:8-oxo-dGTP pyrophosphatase MutT (NUDIX family)